MSTFRTLSILVASFALVASLNAQLPIPSRQASSAAPADVPAPAPDTPVAEAETVKIGGYDHQEAVSMVNMLDEKLTVYQKKLTEVRADLSSYVKVWNGLEKARLDALGTVRWYSIATYVLLGFVLVLLFRNHSRFRLIVGVVAIVVVLMCVFARPANAATFGCVNPDTSPSNLPLVVVGVKNTLNCNVSGAKVEVVEVVGGVEKSVLHTATTPKSFAFTPAASGRAVVKVDGKMVSPLTIAEATDAGVVNAAVDLAVASYRPAVSSSAVDPHVRLVLEGMACPTSEATCLTDFRRKAWGSGKGTSVQTGTALRGAIVDQTLSDPRLKVAFADALKVFGDKLPAAPIAPPTMISATPNSTAPSGAVQEVVNRIVAVEGRQNLLASRQVELGSRLTTAEERMVTLRDNQNSDHETLAVVGAAVITDSRSNKCAAFQRLMSLGMLHVGAKAPKGCKAQ